MGKVRGQASCLPELRVGGLEVLGLCHLELRYERTLGTRLPGVIADVYAQDPALWGRRCDGFVDFFKLLGRKSSVCSCQVPAAGLGPPGDMVMVGATSSCLPGFEGLQVRAHRLHGFLGQASSLHFGEGLGTSAVGRVEKADGALSNLNPNLQTRDRTGDWLRGGAGIAPS